MFASWLTLGQSEHTHTHTKRIGLIQLVRVAPRHHFPHSPLGAQRGRHGTHLGRPDCERSHHKTPPQQQQQASEAQYDGPHRMLLAENDCASSRTHTRTRFTDSRRPSGNEHLWGRGAGAGWWWFSDVGDASAALRRTANGSGIGFRECTRTHTRSRSQTRAHLY